MLGAGVALGVPRAIPVVERVGDAPSRKYQSRKRSLPTQRHYGEHLPVVAEKQGRCVYCYHSSLAAMPKVGYPSIKCKTCDIYLCLQRERNCFVEYHCGSDEDE